MEAGVSTSSPHGTWSHEAVQAAFARELITRRKLYPAEPRDVLACSIKPRQAADYTYDVVSEAQAARALGRARGFVRAVQSRGRTSQ